MKALLKLASSCCLLFSLALIAILLYIIISQARDINGKTDSLTALQLTPVSRLACLTICRNQYNGYSSQSGDICCLPLQISNCVSKDLCKSDAIFSQRQQIKGMQSNLYYELAFIGCVGLIVAIFLCYKCAKRREQRRNLMAAADNLQGRIHSMIGRMNNCNEPLIKGSREQLPQSQTAQNQSETCAICLQEFQQRKAIKLACGHSFHSSCIGQWVQLNARCPVCRTRL